MANESMTAKPKGVLWMEEIERYRKAAEPWESMGGEAADRYALEKERATSGLNRPAGGTRSKFNILWSNVQVQKPTVFSKIPQVVAMRRHKDKDPIGRIAAEVVERSANAEAEKNNMQNSMNRVTLDTLLPGRGVPWVRFEADDVPPVPLTVEGDQYFTPDGEPVDAQNVEDGKQGPQTAQGIANERTVVDYVHWKDFAHAPERTWADVKRGGWVARRIALNRSEGVKRFGSKFNSVKLTLASKTGENDKAEESGSGSAKYAEVWEVWDADSRKRIFIAKGMDKALQETDDPYGLEGFFPCPKPAYSTLGNKNLFPTPDFALYKDLAEELDLITQRIERLTSMMRVTGIYDGSAPSIGTMLDNAQDGKMISVPDFQSIVAKSGQAGGGMRGVVQFMPLADIAGALTGLYAAREQVKQTIFEVTGLSDIVRGNVDPREKATQSRLKAQFAAPRIEQRRREVERVARDVARIQVEMMVELFNPLTLREMSGFDYMDGVEGRDPGEVEAVWAQVVDLLQNEKARGFRIDVETDSTVELDAAEEQERRVRFLESVGNFLEKAIPAMEAAPALAPVLGELVLFAVRSYRAGRNLESAFEEAIEKINQAAEQAEQQQAQGPPTDPEAEAKAARIQQQTQIDAATGQAKVAEIQQRTQLASQKGNLEMAGDQETLKAQLAKLYAEIDKIEAQIDLQQQGSGRVQ